MASCQSEFSEGMFITERNQELNQLDYSILRYKMDFKNRGNAIIINNRIFKKNKPRYGSEKDVNRMNEVLRSLGFNVITKQDMSVKEMKNFFDDIGKADHSENSCFLAVIMSHGSDNDEISGIDGDTVTITKLVEYFLPDRCKSLTGKPKLFFIQSCRGTKLDKGVEVPDVLVPKKKNKTKIPLWADLLISYSNVPGYYSFLNDVNGSWYIQSLADVLQHHGKNKELTTLLTMVNAKVAQEYESKCVDKAFNKMKEMPTFSSTLTREFYF